MGDVTCAEERLEVVGYLVPSNEHYTLWLSPTSHERDSGDSVALSARRSGRDPYLEPVTETYRHALAHEQPGPQRLELARLRLRLAECLPLQGEHLQAVEAIRPVLAPGDPSGNTQAYAATLQVARSYSPSAR